MAELHLSQGESPRVKKRKKKVCLVKSSVFTLAISPDFRDQAAWKFPLFYFFFLYFFFFFFFPFSRDTFASKFNFIRSILSLPGDGREQGSKLSTWEQISIGRHCANNRDFHRFIDLPIPRKEFFSIFARIYIIMFYFRLPLGLEMFEVYCELSLG